MKLRRLKTENFRNLAAVDLVPGPGVNVIYGENAQGKTNLIEAIYLLTGQKSFRAAKESDYLRFGTGVAPSRRNSPAKTGKKPRRWPSAAKSWRGFPGWNVRRVN